MYTLRKSTLEDIDAMVKIAEDGRALLKSQGISQWQRGTYPSRDLFVSDVAEGIGYVLVDEEQVVAICAVTFTDEESYRNMTEGKWLTGDDERYATIHRGAVAKEYQGKSIPKVLFEEVAKVAKASKALSVRADTHPDNKAMQRAMEKSGFTKCGELILIGGDEDGDLRYGYEKLV